MAENENCLSDGVNKNSKHDFFNGDEIKSLSLNGDTNAHPEWLQGHQCPFNWLQVRFKDIPSEEVITKLTERPEMDEGLNESFPYEKFVCYLTLAFELCCQKEESKAWEKLKLCDELLEKEKLKDKTCSNLSEALNHCLFSTKAHLLFFSGKETEAKQGDQLKEATIGISETVAAGVQPVGEMSTQGLAAVEGLKAQFYHHYRGEGAKLALQHARNALALEPDSPRWLVLTSSSIRRVRKFQPSMEEVSQEEIEFLERAVGSSRSARHLLLLAQAYREASDYRFKKNRNEPDFFQSQTFHEISDMQAKAFQLYSEALALRPASEVVNRLCGCGLLRLPAFLSDYRLAERCLQIALEQAPTNSITIHALGLYYYKGLMDYEKAALFCEKAGKLGNFSASLDTLRMKRLMYGNNYDPVFDFQKLSHQYGDDRTKRHEILCQMGSYYLLFERNLGKSLKYFKALIKENAELAIITSHKSTFLNMANKIKLLQYIVNSGLQLLQEKELNRDVDESSIEEINIFLNDLKTSNPELFEVPINVNLINDLHKVSEDIKQTYIRKKERRASARERRKSSLTERRCSLDSDISTITSRRSSETSINFRRRSSGNIESFKNRSCQNFNDTIKKSISSKKSIDDDMYRRKRKDFQKSNGYYLDRPSNICRRQSSGCISDVGRECTLHSSPSPNEEKRSINNSTILWETSHNANKLQDSGDISE